MKATFFLFLDLARYLRFYYPQPVPIRTGRRYEPSLN